MLETKTSESQARLSSLEASLLDNFYWSFHHSQGEPRLQFLIYRYLAPYYRPLVISGLHNIESSLGQNVRKMAIPQQHTRIYTNGESGFGITPQYAQESEAGFQKMWKSFIQTLQDVHFTTENFASLVMIGHPNDYALLIDKQESKNKNWLLLDIARFIIARDGRFQAADRENRNTGSDPHQSFLQTYAYEKAPTTSSEYDQMYRDIRQLLDNIGLSSLAGGTRLSDKEILMRGIYLELEREGVEVCTRDFRFLLKEWKRNHRDQSFVPHAVSVV